MPCFVITPKFLKSSVFPASIDMFSIEMLLGSDKSDLLYFYGKRLFFRVFFFLFICVVEEFFLVPVYKDVRNTSYTRTIVFPPPYLRGSCYGVHGEPCMSLSTANFGSVFCLVYKTVLKHLKLIYQHNRN